MTGLREEFEPLLISPAGLHPDAEPCRQSWDLVADETGFKQQIEHARLWLSLQGQTKHIKASGAGSSYSLTHQVEGWYRRNGSDRAYVSNGCFLMAAHRLGFKLRQIPASNLNAWINISVRRLKVSPADAIKREIEEAVRGLTPDEVSRWLDERDERTGAVGLWKTMPFTPEAAELFRRETGMTVEEVRKRSG